MTHRCFNCGAVLRYGPEDRTVVCSVCGTENKIKSLEPALGRVLGEKELLKYLQEINQDLTQDNKLTVKCTGCGADVEFSEPIISAECPYCASPIVLSPEQIPRRFKPNGIVPFEITKENARKQFRKWARKKLFAPTAFFKYLKTSFSLKAEYVPYWIFDTITISYYVGQRISYDYEKIFDWQVGEIVNRVKYKTNVTDTICIDFSNILAPATSHIPYLSNKISWNITKMIPYNTHLLSGFYSRAYDISPFEAFQTVKKDINTSIQKAILHDIGGDKRKIYEYDVSYRNFSFKQILLPIYYGEYKIKNKEYPYIINGQTGEVYGKNPVSFKKIFVFILAILMALWGLFVGQLYLIAFTILILAAIWTDYESGTFFNNL